MRIVILGKGRFGTLLQQHLQTDNTVQMFEKQDDKAVVREADLVILAVPNRSLEAAVKEIQPFVTPRAIVMDVGSVKVRPCQILLKHLQQNVLGTHPLFGPDSARDSWQGQKMVFCRLRIEDEPYRRVQEIFRKLGVTVIESTPEEHDRIMAQTQALVHYIGRALIGLQPQEISTPDYSNLLYMMEKVTNDTWELFYDMQTLNPFAESVRHDFVRKLHALEYDIVQNSTAQPTVEELRQHIDRTDETIVALVGQRFELAKMIGQMKHDEHSAIQDPKRETEIFLRLRQLADTYHIPLEVVTHLYDFLMNESRKVQH